MPGGWERFHSEMPVAMVTKELVFDAAHFITDHPAKCSNLHGGRYLLQVQVSGPIDPVTGCVVDYGYLKRVANRLVVERFDHHTLNYAAPELAWRSSTEMLCVYIWEQLIEYLPGLSGLRLYETTQSWCDYQGPSLERYQREGSSPLMQWLQRLQTDAGRQALVSRPSGRLRAVGG
jgi:6-pyruvoyl tetrahydropterin synthase/QueD family protein